MKRVEMLGCRFDALTQAEVVDRALRLVRTGQRSKISTINVAMLTQMQTSRRLRSYVNRCDLVVADGMPLVWASPYFGQALPERVAGIDLFHALAEAAEAEGISIYLLGSMPPVVESAVAGLKAHFPKLAVAGHHHGYFDDVDADRLARTIAASGAKLLFVGMGVPRQEEFIETHWNTLGVNLAIGIGGSFDIVAGVSRRAPKAMQRAGLEWCFRLLQEPRRLARRYLVTNSRFLYQIFVALVLNGRRSRQRQVTRPSRY